MRERPKALQPVLDHNQRAFDRLLRWRRRFALGAILFVPLVATLALLVGWLKVRHAGE